MASGSKSFVNLDALIPRADLFEHPDAVVADAPSLRLTDLEPGLTYNLLRKPDFQRETANWTPTQVHGLIQTFCDSDIIPAIILWQNGNQVFVVDGAHRLSALIAWVRNDYGAGPQSSDLFKGRIPERQRLMHEETAGLVNNSVGTWESYKANNSILGLKALQVQWITGHTAAQAARAFIRINQGGTVIDNLEARILQAARSALSIATRVITRGGSGHPYWKHFLDSEAKAQTPKLGAEIYKLLYEPALHTPIKTLEVPLAGIGYGSTVIRFAFDLVALANDLPVADSTRKPKETDTPMDDDNEGTGTLNYMRRVRKMVQFVLSNEPHSLGLHPLLYFYTPSGTFQPAAFLNTTAWMMSLDNQNKLDQFRRQRRSFEDLILAHPALVKPSTHKLGSGARTRYRTFQLFNRILELLSGNAESEATWETLKEEFPHLATSEAIELEEGDGSAGMSFSPGAKSALSFAELSTAARCSLCGGVLHTNGKVADHAERRSAGGGSSSKNGRWVHPICNSNRDKDENAAALV